MQFHFRRWFGDQHIPRGSRPRFTAVLLLVGIGLVFSACGDDDEDGGDSPAIEAPAGGDNAAAPGGDSITIKLIAFTPTELDVAARATVTWIQDDVATHTVTSGTVETSGGSVAATPDGTFDSGNITQGQDFEFTFSEAGDFPFFCAVHPATMRGVIHVQ